MSKLYRQGKKRKMIKFSIDELAAVDRPAQAGAQALLMKREGNVTKSYMAMVLTSETEGHAHGLYLYEGDNGGSTSASVSEGSETEHSHPWVLDALGGLTIGASDGHTHTVDPQRLLGAMMVLGKKAAEGGLGGTPPVLDNQPVTKETAMTDQEIQALKAQLARAEALSQLNDAQKAYFNGLGSADQASFLTKSAVDRDADIAKALEANPVVYTATDGTLFRKNDDPRMVATAKRADETQKLLEASEVGRNSDRITKRAETELKHYPGDVTARSALVKAVESITDEAQRKVVEAAIKAGDAALSKAFVTSGTQDGGPADGLAPEAKLDALSKKYAADHKVSEAFAYSKVLETEEGSALYAQYSTGRQAN